METVRAEYFSGGLPKLVVLRDGEDLIEATFSITTHKTGSAELLIQAVDIAVNGTYREHYSVSNNGEGISVYGLNEKGDSFQYDVNGSITIDALSDKLEDGSIHTEQPVDFFVYFEKVRMFIPNPKKLVDDESMELGGYYPGTSPGNIVTAAVGLVCFAAPIATAACLIGVAIVFYSQKAN